jgi:hypothetical protein
MTDWQLYIRIHAVAGVRLLNKLHIGALLDDSYYLSDETIKNVLSCIVSIYEFQADLFALFKGTKPPTEYISEGMKISSERAESWSQDILDFISELFH